MKLSVAALSTLLLRFSKTFSFNPAVSYKSTTAFQRHFHKHITSTEPFTAFPRHYHQMTSKFIEEDPYLWLEEVESEESLEFAKTANAKCLQELGDPTSSSTGTYQKVLDVLESNDRIAYPRKYGVDPKTGETILFNLWKDSKNPKGLWRKTTMTSYRSPDPQWKTVLDIDELAKKDGISWVWKGNSVLPRSLDHLSDGKYPTRSLMSLSRGGADATFTKEFDLIEERFLTDDEHPFNLPEAKTRASYKSRDVIFVGSDFGEGSLTDSGYPRVIKEWTRGTKLEDAPIVFEGEKTDVSVSTYINDQRFRGGPIYEIRSRSITFYTSKRWVRRVQFEHLLPTDDPTRETASPPEHFIEVDVQEDASVSYVGKFMIISLRSDWEPKPGLNFKRGSLVYVDSDVFLTKGKESSDFRILFEPTERTAYEGQSITKNYLILSTMDNVKSKMTFFKIDDDGFTFVGGDKEAKILDRSASAVDSTENDEIWIYASGYTQPSSLSFGDASKIESSDEDTENAYLMEDLKSLPAQFDATDLTVVQKFASSKDGTEIPYFMIFKKDIKMDGTNPTLLYGYGGFEISLGPKYISTVGNAWLDRGGVYVEANIRGGGEFGPSWHQQGLKANRNKCYEDFIAVAEDLVKSNVCTPSTLAARGGSNGGLLMGMMYVLRPDLFGAIHCAVPLLDMKRYHTLLAGASWMAEYGDPDTSDWDFLQNYSPYHLIDKEANYPPILVTTSTRDDRVHPGHARKMVKKLWDTNASWPVYYYENIEGGHGGAADAKQSAFMTALAYDFMWNTLKK